ncbi:MAG: Veg family protein [Clostridia bacterium]|nr:Veg family protein [Clostridia bacterium]
MKRKAVSAKEIRDNVAALKGKLLQIKVNKGRKRVVKYSGEIDEVLPSLFTMTIVGEKHLSKLSCSYSDVICGDVILTEKK